MLVPQSEISEMAIGDIIAIDASGSSIVVFPGFVNRRESERESAQWLAGIAMVPCL